VGFYLFNHKGLLSLNNGRKKKALAVEGDLLIVKSLSGSV